MKKLICAKDVEKLIAEGETTLLIDTETIITPSAFDLAKTNGISIQDASLSYSDGCGISLDSQLIYRTLLNLQEAGLLTEALLGLFNKVNKKYEAIYSPRRLKIIKGNSVILDPLESNPGVTFQQVIDQDEAGLEVGFLEVDNDMIVLDSVEDTVYHLTQGSLQVKMNNQLYNLQSGDVVYVPRGEDLEVRAKSGKTRIFFVEAKCK